MSIININTFEILLQDQLIDQLLQKKINHNVKCICIQNIIKNKNISIIFIFIGVFQMTKREMFEQTKTK